jgi:hypothetical protein
MARRRPTRRGLQGYIKEKLEAALNTASKRTGEPYNQTSLAAEMGLTRGQVWHLLHPSDKTGTGGVGEKSINGFLDLFDLSRDELEFAAIQWEELHPGEPAPPPPPTEPRVEYPPRPSTAQGSIRGWDAAEAVARDLYRGVPEIAWIGARGVSGFDFPEDATPEFVWQLAMDWMRISMLRRKK